MFLLVPDGFVMCFVLFNGLISQCNPSGLTGDQWLILNASDGFLMGSKGVLQETRGLYWKSLSQFPLSKTINGF